MPIGRRQKRQRPLSVVGKEPLGGEFFLELLEGQIKRALPPRLHAFDIELKIAAHGIKTDPPEAEHCHAVFRHEAQARSLAPEQHGRDLALFIFEREVKVARRRDAQVGNFAHHPEGVELRFQGFFDDFVQLADRKKRALRLAEQRGV